MQIISPKYDFSMKELFNNVVIRKYFICDVLDISVEKVRSVRLLNTFLWKRYRWQKQGILDVLVELNNNTKINIEMQVAFYSNWDRRTLFYLAKMYTDDMRVGEKYGSLKRSIHISVLDFDLTEDEEYHKVYRLRDEAGHEFSDVFEVHIIELRKKLKGNTRIDDWIRLFNAESEEDLDMIQTRNAGIVEAIKEVKLMSLSKRMRLLYEARMKARRDRRAREEYVRQEGRQVGLQEGFSAGKEDAYLELIRRKREKGQSIEQIAEALEKTPEYVAELVKKLEDGEK